MLIFSPLFLHNTFYLKHTVFFLLQCFLRIGVFCSIYHEKMYNLSVFLIGLFSPKLSFR